MAAVRPHKASINQQPDMLRKALRLGRVEQSIAQLTEQLETPFRHEGSKADAEAKLAKLLKERDATRETLKLARQGLDLVVPETRAELEAKLKALDEA